MKTTTAQLRRDAAVPRRTEPEPGPSTGRAAAVYFALSFLYFAKALLPDRLIFGTDYLAGSYVFYDFVSKRLAEGALPKWVPYIFGGLPLFSNNGSTFYPIHLLASALLPTGKVFPVLFIVQFALSGLGMYLLTREMECRRWVALIAGLAFEFTGITMSWVYAGHDGRIIVATLAPLFLFFLHRGIRTAALAPFVGAAATLGFALLSFQIQNAYYLLLAGALWAIFALVHLGVAKERARLGRVLALGLGAVALGFALAAVNFLPFIGYTPESPRGMAGGRGYEYSTSFSMPPGDLVDLAVPEQVGSSVVDQQTGAPLFPPYQGPNGFRLHTVYVGATVLLLLALGIYHGRRNRYVWFFGALALFATTLALGKYTPLYRLYYAALPGLNKFRAPDLAFYIVSLSVVCIAALGLEMLARLRDSAALPTARLRGSEPDVAGRSRIWPVGGALVGIAVLGAGLAGASGSAGGWLRFAVFAALAVAVLGSWLRGAWGTRALLLALSAVTVLDLAVIDRKFFQIAPPAEEMFAPDDVVAFLQAQPGRPRVWVLPVEGAYRGGGDYLMRFGIDQVGGEHPNPLQRYYEFVGAGQQTYADWRNLAGDPRFLAMANVRYLIAPLGMPLPGMREAYRGRSGVVYENPDALPRAYLVSRALPAPSGDASLRALLNPSFDPRTSAVVEAPTDFGLRGTSAASGAARITRYTPDEVEVTTSAASPALLVLADNYYAGWEATVDGRPAPILRTNHTFRGVPVPAGMHRVRFVFRPRALYVGFGIYVAGMALLAAYGLWLLARARRRRGAGAGAQAP